MMAQAVQLSADQVEHAMLDQAAHAIPALAQLGKPAQLFAANPNSGDIVLISAAAVLVIRGAELGLLPRQR
jgi:hypothetical protein